MMIIRITILNLLIRLCLNFIFNQKHTSQKILYIFLFDTVAPHDSLY